MSKQSLIKKQIVNKEKLIIENFHKISKQLGMITEIGNYDLLSQYKGDHHGNPMPKNQFLNSLALDERGISILQDLVNLISSDEHWMANVYPNGASYVDLINDIKNVYNITQTTMDLVARENPIKYANNLKDAIQSKKQS
jgi:hypothetical protein